MKFGSIPADQLTGEYQGKAHATAAHGQEIEPDEIAELALGRPPAHGPNRRRPLSLAGMRPGGAKEGSGQAIRLRWGDPDGP